MTKTLAAVLLLAAGFVAAQTPSAPDSAPPASIKKLDQDIRVDRKDIRDDKRSIRRDNAAQRAQIAELNVQEKAAMDAVTSNATLSQPDKNAAKRKIHADFKAKKDAIRAQMKADRKSKRADISAERGEIKKDLQERQELVK
jgi:hypothetical protein